MERAVFFDRDGVIVKNINGDGPLEVDLLELIPEAIPVIKELKERGNKIFIVSNQPNIAQGLITDQTKNGLVRKFRKLLNDHNIQTDGIYYCFHHPQGVVPKYTKECSCKKPKPGMLLRAMEKFNIDPSKSYMIGDRASDAKAGNAAGVRTILIDPENVERNYLLQYEAKADFTVKNISEVLEIIK